MASLSRLLWNHTILVWLLTFVNTPFAVALTFYFYFMFIFIDFCNAPMFYFIVIVNYKSHDDDDDDDDDVWWLSLRNYSFTHCWQCVLMQGAGGDTWPSVHSSRINVSVNKCQYMHSYSLRFLQASNNILINSCSVRVRMVDDVFLRRSSPDLTADHRTCVDEFGVIVTLCS